MSEFWTPDDYGALQDGRSGWHADNHPLIDPRAPSVDELAYHEAGHAVMAVLGGWHIQRGVTIDPAVASCWKAAQPDAACTEVPCDPSLGNCGAASQEHWSAGGMCDVATPNVIVDQPLSVVQDLIDHLVAGPIAAMLHVGKYNRWAARLGRTS